VSLILETKEEISSNIKGTVIDIETIGEFHESYADSRRYCDIQLVIFGFINKNTLRILCAHDMGALSELKTKTLEIIDGLERPFYAFNSDFERGVLFHSLGKQIDFEGELQQGFESKRNACGYLGISNYADPFFDRGYLCMKAWQNRELDKAIAHNRACLLKERDILLKRGCLTPRPLRFVERFG
jgi:hypothetical protein